MVASYHRTSTSLLRAVFFFVGLCGFPLLLPFSFSNCQGNVVLIQYAYPTINYSGDSESMREDLVELVDKVNTQFALPNNPGMSHVARREGEAWGRGAAKECMG